jgi:hypothetical protein
MKFKKGDKVAYLSVGNTFDAGVVTDVEFEIDELHIVTYQNYDGKIRKNYEQSLWTEQEVNNELEILSKISEIFKLG